MSTNVQKQAVTIADDYEGDLRAFLNGYRFNRIYPNLTKKLDALTAPFNAASINEIVLWKIARYVVMSDELLRQLDGMRTLKAKEHRKAKNLLISLLNVRGVQLPVASTFLRFSNPYVFQIIDRHAYRAVWGTPLEAAIKPSLEAHKISEVYFKYLDKLHSLSLIKEFAFRDADRILYELDRAKNGRLPRAVRAVETA